MKRGLSLILCLAILAALSLSASAEQPGFLHSFQVIQGSYLYLSGTPLDGESVSIFANGQQVDCTVTTVQEAELPITYYCVVDQSSSLSISQRSQQKRALTAVSSKLRPIDSMALIVMEESLMYQDPLTTKESQEKEIEYVCSFYNARFTNLNSSIVSILDRVTEYHDPDSLPCILLITDGLDNANVAVSQESLFQSIQSSGLSLHTLSLVDPWSDAYSWSNARRMAEYSSQSVGGKNVIPAENFDSPTCVEDAVEELMDAVLSGSAMRFPLNQIPRGGNSVELEVSLSKNGQTTTNKQTLSSRDLATIVRAEAAVPAQTEAAAPVQSETLATEAQSETHAAEAQPEVLATEAQPETLATEAPETAPSSQANSGVVPWQTAPTQVPTEPAATEAAVPTIPATVPAPAADSGFGNILLYLVIGGFVLVVLLVALAIVLWRKQRDLEPEVSEEHMPDRSTLEMPEMEEQELPSLAELKRRLESGKRQEAAQDTTLPAPNLGTPGCRVRLVPENHPEGYTEFTIGVNKSVTLGRSSKSDIVLNETDRALSGLHFELQWDSRALYLRDRKSTNGTALNGVPLRPEFWTRVDKKAVIHAGSTSYTVQAEKK